MRAIFTLIVLIALVAGGVWWFALRENPDVASPPLMQAEESAPLVREEPGENVSQEEVMEDREEGGIEPPSAADVSTEQSAEERQVVDALQWAGEFRAVFSHIGKLRAIEQGKYSLKEGEEAPDLHREYAALHASFGQLVLPEGDEELADLMGKLDGALGEIIEPISDSPTAEELETAYGKRAALSPKIDALYTLLNARR